MVYLMDTQTKGKVVVTNYDVCVTIDKLIGLMDMIESFGKIVSTHMPKARFEVYLGICKKLWTFNDKICCFLSDCCALFDYLCDDMRDVTDTLDERVKNFLSELESIVDEVKELKVVLLNRRFNAHWSTAPKVVGSEEGGTNDINSIRDKLLHLFTIVKRVR